MYLLNTAHLAYISYEDWQGYSTASQTNYIPVYLQNIQPEPDIRYHHSTVYLRSTYYPNQVLCLGRNYYGAFWKHDSYIYPSYCSWTLKHSTEVRKKVLEYGDQFLMNNVQWPGFALGLDSSGGWVMAITEFGNSDEDSIVWTMKKI